VEVTTPPTMGAAMGFFTIDHHDDTGLDRDSK